MSSRSSVHGSSYANPFSTPARLTPGVQSPARSSARSPARSPAASIRNSLRGSYFPAPSPSGNQQVRQRKFKSSRLLPGEYDEKSWTKEPNRRRKWERIIFYGGVVLGIAIGAFICYQAYASVQNIDYCLIMEDDFKEINKDTWNFEIQRGGFGSGTFEWTTDDPKNIYTDEDGLHIVPTLTTESTDITVDQMNNGYVLNLTTAGTCTAGDDITACSIRSNQTSGAIINPVRSARINTKGKKSIKYGKVEVVAKMPRGDWLWPAIWALPEKNVYGEWPASGEIDIAESRGNKGSDTLDGRNSLIGALHWGPLPTSDGFYKTSGKHNLRRDDYSNAYHKYGLEWSKDYLFTYIDTRLLQVFYVKFAGETMWQRGDFGKDIVNHTALFNPWAQTGRKNTPFDEPFYLILNVAVGGTNGFFPDGWDDKPWADSDAAAPRAFWNTQEQWYPTWGHGDTKGLTVKSVKMYTEGSCGSK